MTWKKATNLKGDLTSMTQAWTNDSKNAIAWSLKTRAGIAGNGEELSDPQSINES